MANPILACLTNWTNIPCVLSQRSCIIYMEKKVEIKNGENEEFSLKTK
jgi:hypothetical protein